MAVAGEERFEAGDIVRLDAGGPPMIVRAVSGDTAYCQWYTGVQLRQGTFLFTSLRNISDQPRSGSLAARAAPTLTPWRSPAA